MSVTLHTTHGPLKIEIFCDAVPTTAENFLALCASDFYTSSPIHRILPNFIVQTGSPASDPKSKSSISIWGGLFADEIKPTLRHNARGIVSMANKGQDTNGSQFFVILAAAPHLDGKNTVFGRLIGDESFDTLDALEKVEADAKGKPKKGTVVKIEKVQIHANPLAG
ncbi:peptidyl-prolyl cis-trans isomerase-like 3 [Aulographum hederae CBS 113979]|uniref:Peptidyl-prolyl cis-trans isomerase n=1 Tax=Aulographum hederae CBS 113979 TaxID=1176131 RepID=A0A6G1GKG3_9PEZI|nr:peptidyl-prolyl cis-trans isomerase-like 3 [Aulographum hederae CBS 113979]